MKLEYIIASPIELSEVGRSEFEMLLRKQGQIDTVTGKLDRCFKICLVRLGKTAVGIGALKQVYKKPFVYADMIELSDKYYFEIGYLFVDKGSIDKSLGSLGIGRYITRLLLNQIPNENVFATTEDDIKNRMLHILNDFGFRKVGKTYLGQKTKKSICLLVLKRS